MSDLSDEIKLLHNALSIVHFSPNFKLVTKFNGNVFKYMITENVSVVISLVAK